MSKRVKAMNEDRKVAVYLCNLDWQLVINSLNDHVSRGAVGGKVLWEAGAQRAQYICKQIKARLSGTEQSGTTGEH
jgi:hypothetical protein